MINIRDAVENDLPGMLAIYNEAILTLTATFDLEVQNLEERKIWFNKYGGNYPLIVAESDEEIAGYACLSPYNSKAAYAKTVELSIYFSSAHRGKGMGTALMEEILRRAKQMGYHTVIAGITAGNDASVKIHEKFGFKLAGCIKEVGYKFNSWQDVLYYQWMVNSDKP